MREIKKKLEEKHNNGPEEIESSPYIKNLENDEVLNMDNEIFMQDI
jgi:hypothetical protein